MKVQQIGTNSMKPTLGSVAWRIVSTSGGSAIVRAQALHKGKRLVLGNRQPATGGVHACNCSKAQLRSHILHPS
eukprot:SAG25_NODE_12810_length_275_cov_0.585227_1_plen_74_part_10